MVPTRYGSFNQAIACNGFFEGANIGAYGIADNRAFNYGVLGITPQFSSEPCLTIGTPVVTDYGVYGIATPLPQPSLSSSFAGFFAGDVHITGALSFGSDRKLKEDIQSESATLDQIMQLQPKTYTYKTDGEMAELNLARGLQHGFIAQELEEVFPELIGKARQQIGLDATADLSTQGDVLPQIEYKTVNYVALIPILTQGMQEQQRGIEARDLRIQSMEEELAAQRILIAELRGEKKKMAVGERENEELLPQLYQNRPNPFGGTTEIGYFLPASVRSASLYVYDMQGQQILETRLEERGESSYTLDASRLGAGMYLYALIADGVEVEVKRMIITADK